MKNRSLILLIISALFIAACAPAVTQEAAEAVAEPMQEVVVEEEVPLTEEEVIEEEVEQVTEDEQVVSFNQDIWPVIEEFALEAHGGSGGVFLESYDDIMNYVEPGNPEGSRLYKALTGNGEKLMPPSGRLPDETIKLFYDWILQGAPNN